MRAICKMELRRRWRSPGAWLFLLIHSLVAAWFLYSGSISGGAAGFENLFRWSLRALCVTCPLLCLGAYGADRKNDAWKRLFARGASPMAIALSRLLAAGSVCLVSAVAATAAPAVLSLYTVAHLPSALCGGAALFLAGWVFSGLCLWVDSLIRRGWLSGLVSAVVLFALCLIPAHFGKSAMFPLSRLEGFLTGVLNGADAVVYLAAGCFLAALSGAGLYILRSRKKWKKPAAMVCGALAAVIALSALLPLLGPGVTSVDATRIHAVTPDPLAKEVLSESDVPVDAYYISTGRDPWVEGLLAKYDAMSPRFHAHHVDLNLHPQALSGFYGAAGQDNCLVLTGGGKYALIPYHSLYAYSYTYDAASGNYVPTDLRFAAQAQILSAVRFLSCEDAPVITALTDHFESTVGEYARQMAYDTGLFVTGGSAEEAVKGDCVLIFAPQTDITPHERDMLIRYLQNGGGLMVATNYQYGNFQNLFSVLAYCGMAPVGTLAVETDASLYMNYPYYPAPAAAAHESTRFVTGMKIAVPTCHAIAPSGETREGLTLTPLLMTSENSYVKTADASTMNPEEGDVLGPVALAVAAEDENMRCVWVSGSDYLADSMFVLNTQNLYFWLGQAQWTSGRAGQTHAVDAESPSMTTTRISLEGMRRLLPFIPLAACAALSLAMLMWSAKRRRC